MKQEPGSTRTSKQIFINSGISKAKFQSFGMDTVKRPVSTKYGMLRRITIPSHRMPSGQSGIHMVQRIHLSRPMFFLSRAAMQQGQLNFNEEYIDDANYNVKHNILCLPNGLNQRPHDYQIEHNWFGLHSLLGFYHNEQHKVATADLQEWNEGSAFGVAKQRMQHFQILQDLAELQSIADGLVCARYRFGAITRVANGHDQNDVEETDELAEIVENQVNHLRLFCQKELSNQFLKLNFVNLSYLFDIHIPL